MEEEGADIIELGIPYSDPLADGPVIQRASHRALEKGIRIDDVFATCTKIREKTTIPLVLLVYYNSIFRYGIDKFIDNCVKCGVDGVVIPDLPMEEREEIQKKLAATNTCLIPLVTLTSEDRIKQIVEGARGFVYCVTSKGITGERKSFEGGLEGFMKKVRSATDTPLVMGFGISDELTVKSLRSMADGLIVGSAIVRKIDKGIDTNSSVQGVADLVKKLRNALDEE